MKIRSTLSAVAVVLWTAAACAQGTSSFTNVVNQTVPDGNQSGLTLSTTVSGVSGPISDLTLSLTVSSAPGSTAFNGDLYAYLAGPNGGFSVLLDRTGVGTGDAFGYADKGMDVTFAIGAPNIHFYQLANTPSFNGIGQLTGTWGADGRTVDPQSSPAAFDAGGTAGLESFINADPNGAWVLFLTDNSGGNTAQVDKWVLNITTVPEPSVWALMAVGMLAHIKFRRR